MRSSLRLPVLFTAAAFASALAGCGTVISPNDPHDGGNPDTNEHPADVPAVDVQRPPDHLIVETQDVPQPPDHEGIDVPPSRDGNGPEDAPTQGRCGRTSESVRISAVLRDGTTVDCNSAMDPGSPPTAVVFDASIVSADPTTHQIVFETCAPNADCAGFHNTITVDSSTLPFIAIPVGAFAHVEISAERSWTCVTRVLITALPTWGGVNNPAGPGTGIYLAAADGTTGSFSDAPFAINRIGQNCVADAGPTCGGGPPDDYALVFESATTQDPAAVVYMGDTNIWALAGRNYEVRNLRSYESGYCDDYWNWGYWITTAIER